MAAIHHTASMVLTLTANQRRVLLLTALTFMVMC